MCKNGEYVSPVDKKSGNFKHPLIQLFRWFFSKQTRFQAKNNLHLKLSSFRNISILQKHKDLNINWRKHGKIWRKWAPHSRYFKIAKLRSFTFFYLLLFHLVWGGPSVADPVDGSWGWNQLFLGQSMHLTLWKP